ncbi:MAG: S1C family serine protease [Acidobacteria bacterium]|nr:S1C family serine protease [Acidobacteriota bacterium]MCA1651350.1 S1C family serine protease [Acidobacteriota bacterium]
MPNLTLAAFSDELADRVAASGASVVQVFNTRRPVSGVAHGADTVITTARAIGRGDGLRVRLPDGVSLEADLAGWDPATGLAVLRTRGAMNVAMPTIADAEPRAGHSVVALARSWSNAVTASAGIVAVVGGPLRTGRRHQIARVFRITASMHEGFAGGGVFDASGRLTGIATAAVIRGFGVAIPAAIAWASATQVLAAGTPRRGFVGLAVHPVELPASQRPEGRERALLVVGVTSASPADAAGVMVGDVLLDVDGHATEIADDLLDLLADRRVGQQITARTLRAGVVRQVSLTIAERGQG